MSRIASLLVLAQIAVVLVISGPSAGSTALCSVHVRPSQNVQAVIDRRPTGSVICFDRGTYRLRSALVPKERMHLIGMRGAILSGAKRLTDLDRQGRFWVATGQRQQQPVSDETCRPVTYKGCRYAEGVYVDGRPLLQVTSRTALGRGRFFFDYGRNEIWMADDPRGKLVETSVASAAMAGFGDQQRGVVVEGFIVQMFASPPEGLPAALKPGNGWELRDNEIRLNHRLGVYANPGVTIVGNDIHDNGLAGIRGQGDSIHVIGNRIVHNNIERFSDAWSGGARFTSTSGLIVRGNLIARNLTFGVKADTNNIGLRIEDNRIIGNRGPGIAHEKGYRAAIVGNYLEGNARSSKGGALASGAQIYLNTSSDTEIAHNTVVSAIPVNAIALRHDNRGSGAYGVFRTAHALVHDNDIRLVRGAEIGLSSVDPDAFTSWGNRFYRNDYRLEALGARYFVWKGSLLDIARWKAAGNDRDGTFARW